MINKKNIEEQKIRRWVRKILVAESNTHLMNERSGETEALYNIFIEPFADVLRVGKMAFKDILTNAKFTFDMLVTFDPWKINDIKNNYKKRKESIKDEWAEVMKPTYDALGAESVHAAALLLNPAVYLTAIAGLGAAKTTKGVIDFLRETGFGPPSAAEKKETGLVQPTGAVSKVFGGLKRLFFSDSKDESYYTGKQIILEQDEPVDLDSAVGIAMDELGITSATAAASEELMQDTKDSLEEIYELVEASAAAIGNIREAQSVDELVIALSAAKTAGLDIGGPPPAELKSNFESDVNDILNDENEKGAWVHAISGGDHEITEQTAGNETDSSPKNVPTISDSELKDKIEGVLYVNATDSLRDSMDESEKELMAQVDELVNTMRPVAEEEKIIAATTQGREYLSLFNNLTLKIKDLL